MTRDERIASIRVGNTRVYPTVNQNDVAFLLAELDAATRCYQRWEELYHQRRAKELAADERAFRAEARVQRLTDAAQAVIERWDTPLWKDAEPTAATINRLRAALAEGEDTRG